MLQNKSLPRLDGVHYRLFTAVFLFLMSSYVFPYESAIRNTYPTDQELARNTTTSVEKGIKAYDNRNYGEAFRIFSQVAVIGGPEVHFRLGLMYAEGVGTEKNISKANYWLKSAARLPFFGQRRSEAQQR